MTRYRLLALLSLALLCAVAASAAGPSSCPNGPEPLPACSTEKVNRNCVFNIDRRFPIAMPTFQMHPGCHIALIVYHPFHFERLTLVSGQVQAQQSSDQGSALLAAAIPDLKGLQVLSEIKFNQSDLINLENVQIQSVPSTPIRSDPTVEADLEKLKGDFAKIQTAASNIPEQIDTFYDSASIVYNQLTDIGSPMPRPVVNTDNKKFGGFGVPQWGWAYDPRVKYGDWRALLIYEMDGGDGTFLPPHPDKAKGQPDVPWGILGDAADIVAELPPATSSATDPPKPAPKPLTPNLFTDFNSDASTMQTAINNLKDGNGQTDVELQKKYQPTLDDLVTKEQQIANSLAPVSTSLNKVVLDLQTFLTNIIYWTDDLQKGRITVSCKKGDPGCDEDAPHCSEKTPACGSEAVSLQMVSDPVSIDPLDKSLAPYGSLGRNSPYTIFAENQISTSVLGVPTSQQLQTVLPVTALFADPVFEVSSGAFFSTLPNRSFSNYTDIKETSAGSAATADIKISESVARPELLPFAAANWRIGRDYTMPDKRRGAVYGTIAVALNPYNTLPEFAGGMSFSWRNFMFSPLYHLGHGVHLTQGEYVGELWCSNGGITGVPACAGNPPSPSTKTYWTGVFAFGIGIRVPTTFSSSTSGPSGGAGGSGPPTH